VSLRELLVGVEGLALLRNLYDATDEHAARRLHELREVLDDPAHEHAEVTAKRRAFRHIPEATAQAYLGLPAVLVWDSEKAQAPSRSSTGAGISAGASPTT
jgi:hypothetical protein